MIEASAPYVCRVCGKQIAARPNRCPRCKHWGAIDVPRAEGETLPVRMARVRKAKVRRVSTGIEGLDDALGGGLVRGAIHLLSGDPGGGKSTLALQLASRFEDPYIVLGEETEASVKTRFRRLGLEDPGITLIRTTDIDHALLSDPGADLIVLDSLSVLEHPDVEALPGTNDQALAVMRELVGFVHDTEATALVIAHVNKDGRLFGTRAIEHLVDVVMGVTVDESTGTRYLRVSKNRHARTPAVCALGMGEDGLSDAEQDEEEE